MLRRHDAIEDTLHGRLGVPQGPVGLVIITHGGEHFVSEALRARAIATLTVDAYSDAELIAATDWVKRESRLAHLPLAYFGEGDGAAAALIAASRRPDDVRAVVARSGRPDLAGSALPIVRAPTLFIARGDDDVALELDRRVIARMSTATQLAVLPEQLDEAAQRDEIAQLAAEWCIDHFAQAYTEPPARRGTWGRQFRDRRAAGQRLADLLMPYAGPGTIVCGLLRGGVPVAHEIAVALDAPLDVWLVRKIGMPMQPELGMGALAEGAALVLDPQVIKWSGATPGDIRALVHRKAGEIRRRAHRYRDGLPAPDVTGCTVILVDDGIATGGTLRAAVRGARKRGAARVVVAAPVGAPEAIASLRDEADDVVCIASPQHLIAVGAWYQDFRQPPEREVIEILAAARRREPPRRRIMAP